MMRRERDFAGPACRRCETPITSEMKVCPACGRPTIFMTFDERTRWEVEQYRAYKERDTASA
jgi:rRNA maturation endonuclease Nob1